jgi:hypothetical protein
VFAAISAGGSTALAHSAGQPGPGCSGCHATGDYAVSVDASPASWAPGEQVTFTVTVAPGFGQNAGVFVAANEGALAVIGGQGLAAVPAGLTHTSPKGLSGGQASFSFAWTAPGAPGAVRFDVSTLVGNGSGGSGGDAANRRIFDFVYGCQPATYWADSDGDGFGADAQPLIHCDTATPSGYAAVAGDCNDVKVTVYPGAVEYCNQLDDDCDGEVDDDAIPVVLYPDADGDGYYGNSDLESGETITGCVPTPGYAAEPGDCATDDPTINPGVEEVCNLVDDNCNSRIDEYVRPRCGEGWCQREASSCDGSFCTPGEPKAEECNLLDDNCDGIVDEGKLCPTGQTCIAAVCTDEVAPPPQTPPASDGCAIGGGTPWLAAGWLVVAAALARRRRSGSRRS